MNEKELTFSKVQGRATWLAYETADTGSVTSDVLVASIERKAENGPWFIIPTGQEATVITRSFETATSAKTFLEGYRLGWRDGRDDLADNG